MPVTQARTGFGTRFYMCSAADVATLVLAENRMAEVIGLKPPSSSWDTAEATHFDSPDMFREWIKTLRDGGEADIKVNMAPGSPTDLAMQEADDDEEAWAYGFFIPKKGGGWHTVKGYCLVTGYDRETPHDDRMTATSKLKFTGARTEAAAAQLPVGA